VTKRRASQLVGCTAHAKDGHIGKVKKFHFDDHRWTVRSTVVDAGRWLRGRPVPISTAALEKPDWEPGIFHVNTTKCQVKGSPDVDK
jgi:hypothetical protein